MKRKLLIVISGGLCFFVSQVVLRIPLLNFLQGTTEFNLFYNLYPLLVGILIAFSAGIFEEGFRFIFRASFLKRAGVHILNPIIFGLGHGLVEVFIVLGPYLFTVPLESLALGIIERILAIILHIGLTVVVWNGFQLNKKVKYLFIAITIHGLTNSLIPILISLDKGIILIESALAIIDIAIIIYVYKSRKHYLEEKKNEEI